ncbi:hypothetical protein Tco_0826770 [Tanacetum coccineum]
MGLTIFTLLPCFTLLLNQRAFPNWRVRKSIQVVYITLAELKRHSSTLLANSNKGMPRGLEESTRMCGFYTSSTHTTMEGELVLEELSWTFTGLSLDKPELDDESLSEEEIQKDEFKYFSNLFCDLDDEIITNEKILPNQKDLDVVIPIPPGIDKHCFNAESDLLESLLNRDSPIDSTKIDSIFDEFSLPRPPEESNSEYSDATIESLSPSPIPVEDSDPFMEEIDIFLASDDSTPPGVESDYDSEGDILLLEELLNDDLVPLAEYNHFTFDVEPDTSVKNDFDELNEDECFDPGGGKRIENGAKTGFIGLNLVKSNYYSKLRQSREKSPTAIRAERERVREEATRAGGLAGGPAAAPVARECTFTGFMKCGPTQFHGTEGAVGHCRWFEKMESTFGIILEVANGKPWTEVKQMMTDEFCPTGEVQRLEDELRHLKLRDIVDLSDDEASYHEDASDNGTATNKPKQRQQQLIPTTTTISNIKLLILKKEEYDIWAMEMEHYLEYIDNDVWKVIQNGNSKKRISTGKDGVVRILPPVSAAEIHAVEKERKARTILLMAIPKEHLRRFHGMDDAKEIWEAIRTRFGGNANSKKMQKAVLKQQFEAFTISSSEGLEKGYDRFQQLLSQLEAHGAEVSTEDANHKFLRSLPLAWSNLAMTMRTKPDVDTLSIDDLYNNLRVFEQELTSTSKSSASAQNVAFVSHNKSSTNKVKSGHTGPYTTYNFFYFFKTISRKRKVPAEDLDLLHEDLEQIDDLDIEEIDINWQIAMIAIRIKKFYKKTGRRVRIDGNKPVGFDKKKLECFKYHNTGHFAREYTSKGTNGGKKRDSFLSRSRSWKEREESELFADYG